MLWCIFIYSGNGRLSLHALATNATHAGGYVELDTHNLWGMMEEKATHLALQSLHPGKRPFLISRSTFPAPVNGPVTGLATTLVNGSTCTSTSKVYSSSSCSRFQWSVRTRADSTIIQMKSCVAGGCSFRRLCRFIGTIMRGGRYRRSRIDGIV